MALIFLPTAREVQMPRHGQAGVPNPQILSSYLAVDLTGDGEGQTWPAGPWDMLVAGGVEGPSKAERPCSSTGGPGLYAADPRASWTAASMACRAQFMGCPPPHPEATQARLLGLRASREGHYLMT